MSTSNRTYSSTEAKSPVLMSTFQVPLSTFFILNCFITGKIAIRCPNIGVKIFGQLAVFKLQAGDIIQPVQSNSPIQFANTISIDAYTYLIAITNDIN